MWLIRVSRLSLSLTSLKSWSRNRMRNSRKRSCYLRSTSNLQSYPETLPLPVSLLTTTMKLGSWIRALTIKTSSVLQTSSLLIWHEITNSHSKFTRQIFCSNRINRLTIRRKAHLSSSISRHSIPSSSDHFMNVSLSLNLLISAKSAPKMTHCFSLLLDIPQNLV